MLRQRDRPFYVIRLYGFCCCFPDNVLRTSMPLVGADNCSVDLLSIFLFLFLFYLFAKIAPGVWSLPSRQLLSKARACGSAGRGCTFRRTLTTQISQNPIRLIKRRLRGLSQIRWAHKSFRLASVISAQFYDRLDCRWWPSTVIRPCSSRTTTAAAMAPTGRCSTPCLVR